MVYVPCLTFDVIRRTEEELKRTTRLLKQFVSLWGYLWFPGCQVSLPVLYITSIPKGLITQIITLCGHLLKQQRLPHLQSTHGCIVCETTSSMKHYHVHFDFLKNGNLDKCFVFNSETVQTGNWLCKFITHN